MKYLVHFLIFSFMLIIISSCISRVKIEDKPFLKEDSLAININEYVDFYESLPNHCDSVNKSEWIYIARYMNQAILYLNSSYLNDLNIESDIDFKFVLDSVNRPNREVCQEIFRQLSPFYDLAIEYKLYNKFDIFDEFKVLYDNINLERDTYSKYANRVQSIKDAEVFKKIASGFVWEGELRGDDGGTAKIEYRFYSDGDGSFDVNNYGASIYKNFKYEVKDNYLIITVEGGDGTYYWIKEITEKRLVFGSHGHKDFILHSKY